MTAAPSHQQQPGAMSAPVTANQPACQKDATSEKSKKIKNDTTNHVDWDAVAGAYAGRTR
jgi:hypothetical protein